MGEVKGFEEGRKKVFKGVQTRSMRSKEPNLVLKESAGRNSAKGRYEGYKRGMPTENIEERFRHTN